jgi:hypothetical protein
MNRDRIFEELKEIQGRIPKIWLQSVVVEKEATPTIKKIMEAALNEPQISQEKKQQIRNLLEAGTFSKKEYGENPRFKKQIDEFLRREINKKIKKGLLPRKLHADGNTEGN